MGNSSSVGVIQSTGHNSNSSQARFDGGARYFGDVTVAEPIEEGYAAASANLLPCGMIYVLDNTSANDDEDLFSNSGAGETASCVTSLIIGEDFIKI